MRRVRYFIRVQQLREISLLLILAAVIYFFGREIEDYYTARMYNRIATQVALIAVIAVGQTLVVLTRNIDLSVGSIVGFTAFYLGDQLSKNPNIDLETAVAIAVGVGATMGLVNGLIVAYGRVPSIVVTLGTLAIYRGLLVEYSGSQSIQFRQLPDWIKTLPSEVLYENFGLDLRPLPAIAIGVMLVFQVVLLYTIFGRRLYAIGSSPEAAELAGIPSRRMIMLAFVISGALSGLGGFMYLARIGTITTDAARGLELQVVAAVVVGGVNIFGGSGTVFGAFIGVILISTIELSLIRMQINEFWKDALLGAFIMVAVLIDTFIMGWLRALWSRTELRRASSVQKVQSI
ncbi:MAG: ABC transporter permease [Chloroflexi bacterium]|nr:ABC transporter permease [Chloroflexota bacterium]